MKTRDEIIEEIEEFRNENPYSDYYIGITNDVKRRLNEDTKLSKDVINEHARNGRYSKEDEYYSEDAGTNKIAAEIERHFQDLGMNGKPKRGGSIGKEDTTYVYVFKDHILLNEMSDHISRINEIANHQVQTK